jgi:hypothetical protein
MDQARQLADRPANTRPAGTRPAGTRPADVRPAWWGLVTLVAGALSVPLVLVDPVLAATLGIVVGMVGVLGARSSTGTERRQHVAGAVLGAVTEVVLVLALTVLGSSLGAAAPWPTLVNVP